MFHRSSIFTTTIFILFATFYGEVNGGQSSIKVFSYQINAKKTIHAVNDKFLSYTIDPGVLLHVPECRTSNSTLNLIRGILPAYLRVAGPETNKLVFRNSPNGKPSTDTAANAVSTPKNGMLQLTGPEWIKFNEFVSRSGLNVIISLNGGIFNKNDRDLSNALEFIKFSNENNLNLDWQLGYELQRISKDDGKGTGRDVTKLKNILELFPLYHKSLILGPDMTSFENRDDATFIKNYLTQAQNSLNAFTIHPDFSSLKENDDVQEMLSNILAKLDNVLWTKESAWKTLSKSSVPRKPIWIAESERKDQTCKFSDALSMIKRLGATAKLGVSVYLQKPHLLSLFEPTPEYWASVLFKALVGRGVLDMKLANGNNTKLQLFSHCTQIPEKPEESIINPTTAYERGSITVYGVNTGSEPARLSLKIGLKFEDIAHLYILTEEVPDDFSKTLLNKQPLGLSNEGELPMISPKVRESARYLTVPARSIFFVVFPNAKSRACVSPTSDELQDLKKIKSPSAEEDEDMDDASFASNFPEIIEDDADDKTIYVSYPKREERRNMARPKHSLHSDDFKYVQPKSEPNFSVKYVAFPDAPWLSPERFREFLDRDRQYEESMQIVPTRKEIRHAKTDKHVYVGKAIPSKRNHTSPIVESENMDTDTFSDEKPGRYIRSIGTHPTSKSAKANDEVVSVIWSPSKSFVDHSQKNLFIERPKRGTNAKSVSKRQISDNNEMDNETVDVEGTTVDNAVHTTASANTDGEEFDIDEGESTEIVRENRQINDNGEDRNSANNAGFLSVPRRTPKTFGPVSPFPRKSKKLQKVKYLKGRNGEDKAVGSAQSAVIPGILSSSRISNTSSVDHSTETNVSTIISESTTEVKEKFTTTNIATDSVTVSSSESTTSRSTNTEMPEKLYREVSSQLPQTSSTTAQSSATESTTISTVSTSVNSSDGVSSVQSSARSDNTDEDDLEDIRLATKIVSPILHTDHHTNVDSAAKDSNTKLENDNNRVSLSLNPRIRSKDFRKEIRAKPKHPPTTKIVSRPTLKIKTTKVEPTQVIDFYNAKIKELLDQHLAKLEEMKRKIQEKSAAARKAEERRTSHLRSKREVSANNTVESDIVEVQKQNDSQPTDDVVGVRRQKPANSVHPARATTTSISSTPRASIPRKSKHARLKPIASKRTRLHTTPTPRTAIHENKLRPTISPRSRPDPILRQKRSFAEDIFESAGNVYEKVSKEVTENIKPITKWVQARVEDVKDEFSTKRHKRDLEAIKEKLSQLRQKAEDRARHRRTFNGEASAHFPESASERAARKMDTLQEKLKLLRQKMEDISRHHLTKRDVSSDQVAKKHGKIEVQALLENVKQLKQKAKEKLKSHHILKRDVSSHHAKIADKKKEREARKRTFEFQLNLLKNRTAKSHPENERKKMAERLRSHAIFRRQATGDVAANRYRRSVSDNEIFDDDEKIRENKRKNHYLDTSEDLLDKRYRIFDNELKAEVRSWKPIDNEFKAIFPRNTSIEENLNTGRSKDSNEGKAEHTYTHSLWDRERKTDTTNKKTETDTQNSENTHGTSNSGTTTIVVPQEDDDQCKDTHFFRYCWCRATYLLQYFSRLFRLQRP